MIPTIRVTSGTDRDPEGAAILAEVRRTLGMQTPQAVRTAKVYRLEGITAAEADRLARELLAEAVDQRYTLNAPVLTEAENVVEIAYLPGVMNPEAASILRAAGDLGIFPVAVDASREVGFVGAVAPAEVDVIVRRLLMNPTIERVVEAPPETLVITGSPGGVDTVPLLGMGPEELMARSAEGLALDLAEMQAIQAHFAGLGRDPTDAELEILAQTWSEHCKHKTFKSKVVVNGQAKPSFMRRLMETARQFDELVVSAFVDNSGVMAFYDGWALAGKVETHNSPSAIEPYGGAMTGSGGVFRDILGTGLGARVVCSTDIFCFAPPDLPDDEVPPGAWPPAYLLRRVVAGVRDYGNRMGIPTNNGSVHFHPDFRAKPTVIVGAYGLLPEAMAQKGTPQAGDRILVVGGRTGRDGIHGATFSSTAMTKDTVSVNATAVQIGNAVEEKRLLDAVLAMRDAGLIRAITDCGAGGFSSAIGEMAEGVGAGVELEKVPLKYPGLAPWEIFLSESQERMVLAVDPANVEAAQAIGARYRTEVTDIGAFEPSGRLRVTFDGTPVADLDLAFLHDGLPERVLEGWWEPSLGWAELPAPPATALDWERLLEAVFSHPNVASKEAIVRQYDHTVQGSSAVAPYNGPAQVSATDAAVIAPVLGRPYGLVVAHGLCPALSRYDPYWAAVWAAAEALAGLVAVGGNHEEACLIDNFIWPVPDSESLAQLDRAVDGCVAVMKKVRRPFVSGKDSLSSTYRYPDGRVLHIPPVICISVFGRIPDVAKTIGPAVATPEARLVMVGKADWEGMGGSTYMDLAGMPGERCPQVDLDSLPPALEAVRDAIAAGAVEACHDVSEGGLVVAAAEMAFGTGLGVELDAATLPVRPDLAFLNETAGVFLVALAQGIDPADFFSDVPHAVVGRVTTAPVLRLRQGGTSLVEVQLERLRQAWARPVARVFAG